MFKKIYFPGINGSGGKNLKSPKKTLSFFHFVSICKYGGFCIKKIAAET
jgi:hypothetical protein